MSPVQKVSGWVPRVSIPSTDVNGNAQVITSAVLTLTTPDGTRTVYGPTSGTLDTSDIAASSVTWPDAAFVQPGTYMARLQVSVNGGAAPLFVSAVEILPSYFNQPSLYTILNLTPTTVYVSGSDIIRVQIASVSNGIVQDPSNEIGAIAIVSATPQASDYQAASWEDDQNWITASHYLCLPVSVANVLRGQEYEVWVRINGQDGTKQFESLAGTIYAR